jgi:DNA gyrase/topoisomerase IV subunit B
VRDATALQISENQEIQHIKQILGLQHGKNYEDVKALRYGHLMIMTDQVIVDVCISCHLVLVARCIRLLVLCYGHLMIMADQVRTCSVQQGV